MKFCPVVPEICRGQVHGPRKERRIRIKIIKTRYDYNLTIMKSPMWIDYDVPNWFLTLKNFYQSPFSKWLSQYRTNSTLFDIFQCRESIRDIIIYPHIKFWWYRTMLNFYPPFLCHVLAAILKMADILKILKHRIAPYSPFFPWTMNLSTADLRNHWTEFHETWWSYRYMFLVDPKVC
jgi:hypothetical protein